jgi:hypothetical protein
MRTYCANTRDVVETSLPRVCIGSWSLSAPTAGKTLRLNALRQSSRVRLGYARILSRMS